MATIKERFGDPFAYARATMTPDMDDRQASVWLDACVSQWDEYKDEECRL